MDTAVRCGREAFVFFLTRARERIKTALEKIASNIYKKNKKRRKKMVLSTKKKRDDVHCCVLVVAQYMYRGGASYKKKTKLRGW